LTGNTSNYEVDYLNGTLRIDTTANAPFTVRITRPSGNLSLP